MSDNKTESLDLNKMRDQALVDLGVAKGKVDILNILIKTLTKDNEQKTQEEEQKSSTNE